MAGTIVVDTIQSGTALPPTVQNTSGTQIGTFCRAWVNFNGTGTVAIRASFNVTSLTDTSTGTYFVNFTTAMPDANYSVCGTAATPGSSYGLVTPYNGATVQTTTAVPISALNAAWAVFDHTYISVAIFR